MGLSNYLPSSRISQAGVIPNAAARPASPYEGQLVYQMDDNSLYIYDGSNWVKVSTLGDRDQIGLWKIIPTSVAGTNATISPNGTVTANGGTTVSLNGVFTSAYRSYRVVIEDLYLATGAQSVNIRLRKNGTDSQSSYYYAGHTINYNSGFANNNIRSANTTGSAEWYGTIGIATARSGTIIDIINPQLSQTTTYISSRQDPRSDGEIGFFGGFHAVAESYDGLTILTGGTNLAGISVRVYGYN